MNVKATALIRFLCGSRLVPLCLVLLLAAGSVAWAMAESESAEPTQSRNLSPRIIGGSKANPRRYPYYTYIEVTVSAPFSEDIVKCGGTLIAADVVLTAAHCLIPESQGEYVTGVNVRINATVNNYDTPYDYERTANYLTHPLYNPNSILNDIALVFLEDPVTGIPLPKINDGKGIPAKGRLVTAVGLGLLQNSPDVEATFLMDVSVQTLAGSLCVAVYKTSQFRPNDQLCAGGARGTCRGDSGGPLLVKGTNASNDVLVGITSYGAQTCGLLPNVYTRVSRHSQWINFNVCLYSGYKPATCN